MMDAPAPPRNRILQQQLGEEAATNDAICQGQSAGPPGKFPALPRMLPSEASATERQMKSNIPTAVPRHPGQQRKACYRRPELFLNWSSTVFASPEAAQSAGLWPAGCAAVGLCHHWREIRPVAQPLPAGKGRSPALSSFRKVRQRLERTLKYAVHKGPLHSLRRKQSLRRPGDAHKEARGRTTRKTRNQLVPQVVIELHHKSTPLCIFGTDPTRCERGVVLSGNMSPVRIPRHNSAQLRR
mmetsp:Transcript_9218/g.22159  ORF Transcript_9218/g.22159 Transcript_9218/m.22159 type:complete len:241 (-) Transcript_9218:790-1512(-)